MGALLTDSCKWAAKFALCKVLLVGICVANVFLDGLSGGFRLERPVLFPLCVRLVVYTLLGAQFGLCGKAEVRFKRCTGRIRPESGYVVSDPAPPVGGGGCALEEE